MVISKESNESKFVVSIPIVEFLLTDISSAIEIFNEELKWDTLMYFGNVRIVFDLDYDPQDTDFYHSKECQWYLKLVKELPEFLYFLDKDQLKEVGQAFEIYKPFDSDIKKYFLESIADLHYYYSAPVDLVIEVSKANPLSVI